MLDTEAYLADCRRLLGGILCHRTSRRPEETAQAAGESPFDRTCRLAAHHLGIDVAMGTQPPVHSRAGHGWHRDRWNHPAAILVREGMVARPLLTVAEVAEITRLSKPTIYRLIDSGGLEAIRIGGTLRVPESAVRGCFKEGSRSSRPGVQP